VSHSQSPALPSWQSILQNSPKLVVPFSQPHRQLAAHLPPFHVPVSQSSCRCIISTTNVSGSLSPRVFLFSSASLAYCPFASLHCLHVSYKDASLLMIAKVSACSKPRTFSCMFNIKRRYCTAFFHRPCRIYTEACAFMLSTVIANSPNPISRSLKPSSSSA
jgi:hypothetical protein